MFLVIMHLNFENTVIKASKVRLREKLNNQKRVTLMLRGYIKGNEEKKLQKNNEYLDLLNKI